MYNSPYIRPEKHLIMNIILPKFWWNKIEFATGNRAAGYWPFKLILMRQCHVFTNDPVWHHSVIVIAAIDRLIKDAHGNEMQLRTGDADQIIPSSIGYLMWLNPGFIALIDSPLALLWPPSVSVRVSLSVVDFIPRFQLAVFYHFSDFVFF